ncbi:535_t:CDS:2, partial [Ambispora leptoticha]
SENHILLLATGKDYSLVGFQEQQIGRDYLKENKNKIKAIMVTNTNWQNVGLLADICREIGSHIPIYTSHPSKLIFPYLFPQLRNKIIVAEKNREWKIGDFVLSFIPLNSYLLGNLGQFLTKSPLQQVIEKEENLSKNFVSPAKRPQGNGEIYLLVGNPEKIEKETQHCLVNFSPEKKATFQFIVGIPPVIGGEMRLARTIDYLYTQSEEVINLSKKEYLSLGVSFYDFKLLLQLLQPLGIITLQNSYKNKNFLAHLPVPDIKKEDAIKIIKKAVERRLNSLTRNYLNLEHDINLEEALI